MIVEMRKVQIIGPKGYLDECIRVLHAVEIVHIETIPVRPEEAFFQKAFFQKLPMEKEKFREKEELEKASDRVKNLLHLLPAPKSYRALKVAGEEIKRYIDEMKPVEERARALRLGTDELIEELSAISRYERLLRGFAPIVTRLGGLKNFDIVGLTIEKTREDVPKLLDSEVNRITGGNYQIFAKDLDEASVGVVLTYPKTFAQQIKYLLTGKSISEIRLPDEYADLTLINALKLMSRRKAELPKEIEADERELGVISFEWYGRLVGLSRSIDDAIDEIGVIAYAAQTKFTFVIEGWVPASMMEPLKEKFSSLFGDKVLVRELEIREEEKELVPVHIKNPRIFRPFEVFLSALPPPMYGTIDPTPYVALFFPMFFALIVADIGYGAIIFLLSLYSRRRFKDNETLFSIATVLAISSFAAMIFGFLFGEFFGDLGERLGLFHPIIFHRTEALKTLLVLSIGIGVGHVALGIIIGVANHLYRGKKKEAGAKIAYFILIASFLFILGIFFDYIPRVFWTPGVIVLVISFAVLTILEGVLGPLEFIKALGNILSYVRIMAVGTASVVMALVANKIGGLSEDLIVGVLAAGIIHTLNIILSVLSPSIQSMRLQYVEFFSKFYEGGGRKYTPFKKR